MPSSMNIGDIGDSADDVMGDAGKKDAVTLNSASRMSHFVYPLQATWVQLRSLFCLQDDVKVRFLRVPYVSGKSALET